MFNCKGFSLAECLAAVAIAGLALLVVAPSAATLRNGVRLSAGMRELALILQATRWKSVAAHRAHGLLFRRDALGWYWFQVQDGNGNGLRTAEIASGVDRTLTGPHRLEHRVAGVRPGIPDDGPIPAIPPRQGSLDLSVDDPVRFGVPDLIAFGALGTSSSGTLYLTDDAGSLAAITLFGPTARLRTWRFDRRSGMWRR